MIYTIDTIDSDGIDANHFPNPDAKEVWVARICPDNTVKSLNKSTGKVTSPCDLIVGDTPEEVQAEIDSGGYTYDNKIFEGPEYGTGPKRRKR